MSSVIRRVITIVLSCAMVIAVASCGASGDEPGAGTTTTKQGEQTTADDGDNGDNEKTKITFQTWNPDEPAFQKLLEDMDGKLSDVEVELVFIPYSDHISKLKVDLASGEGPMFLACRPCFDARV
jgi:ABC-type glycerol-3-phosphate transport system substrate-binding protein